MCCGGGPSLIRAGAKNSDSVYVATDPADFRAILEALDRDGSAELLALTKGSGDWLQGLSAQLVHAVCRYMPFRCGTTWGG